MGKVHFYNSKGIEHKANIAFDHHAKLIHKMIPDADIQHVGSTAIPDSLTKGDLDIQVRVTYAHFNQAAESLFQLYDFNDESIKTNEFRAFKNDAADPPLGVQLTVIESEYDFFWKFRDILIRNQKLKTEYDEMKLQFENVSMDEYRVAKDKFFDKIRESAEFKNLVKYY